jgi:hypothetical protein
VESVLSPCSLGIADMVPLPPDNAEGFYGFDRNGIEAQCNRLQISV